MQLPVAKTIEVGGAYFEVDNKKNSLKAHSGNNIGSDLFYAHVSAVYFLERLETITSFGERASRFAIFRASLFRVLRL